MSKLDQIISEINRDKVSNIRVTVDNEDFVLIANTNGVGSIKIKEDGEHIDMPILNFDNASEEMHELYSNTGSKKININASYYLQR